MEKNLKDVCLYVRNGDSSVDCEKRKILLRDCNHITITLVKSDFSPYINWKRKIVFSDEFRT